jgi:hypothetical protein
MQLCDLSLFAAQRSAHGRWRLRAPSSDPWEPAAIVVDAIDILSERAYANIGASIFRSAGRSTRNFE